MKKILLYGFGGSYNHGGEAIVVCTIEHLRNKYPGCFIYVSTHFKEQDIEFKIPADELIERDIRYVVKEKEENKPGVYDRLIYADTLEIIEPDMECYSVGGDNYCYGNWKRWKTIHDDIKRKGATDVLWSCSIDKEYLSDELISHLKTFDRITAREQLTYNSLLESGLDNVEHCRDIAFDLVERKPVYTYGVENYNYIVLNVSPLIIRKEIIPNIILDNYEFLMRYILDNTSLSILLLPHVRMAADDDLEPLRVLSEKFGNSSRVHLVADNLSAAECKYLIARCKAGVFARTHAAIAAYSSDVPCFVVGYSAKAKGIAMDMRQENRHISISQILHEDELTKMIADNLDLRNS